MSTSLPADEAAASVTHANPGIVHEDYHNWPVLFRIGALAGSLMLATIPAAIVAYALWPPPYDEPISEWFSLYQRSPLQELLGLDLSFLISNVLMIPLLVTLYVALRQVSESLMALALAFGMVGVSVYFSSNPAVQMWLLSNKHEAASSDGERAALVAAGQAMLATFEGTGFTVYYVLSAVSLLIIASVMLRSSVFSRRTAYVGLVAGVLTLIPANAGTLGVVFSFASLIPWVIFLALISMRMFQLSREFPRSQRHSLP